jgi:hypothetical protein
MSAPIKGAESVEVASVPVADSRGRGRLSLAGAMK